MDVGTEIVCPRCKTAVSKLVHPVIDSNLTMGHFLKTSQVQENLKRPSTMNLYQALKCGCGTSAFSHPPMITAAYSSKGWVAL